METSKPKGIITILTIALLLATGLAFVAKESEKKIKIEKVELVKENIALATRLENCKSTNVLYKDSLANTINGKVKSVFKNGFWHTVKDKKHD